MRKVIIFYNITYVIGLYIYLRNTTNTVTITESFAQFLEFDQALNFLTSRWWGLYHYTDPFEALDFELYIWFQALFIIVMLIDSYIMIAKLAFTVMCGHICNHGWIVIYHQSLGNRLILTKIKIKSLCHL